ncbi:DUF551 domain-containing protein [Escherichia coli]|nr:DUF551 domain-containing protein [Escherichia coli]
MSTITREWLQQAINDYESVRDELPFGLDDYQGNILAALRIALASLEAEPVAWKVTFTQIDREYNTFTGMYSDKAEVERWVRLHKACNFRADITPLYTAKPVPVVPAALPENDDDDGHGIDYLEPSEVYTLGRTAGWNACRAVMLQGKSEQPRNAQQNIPENIPGGNSPVIPDGLSTVCAETYQVVRVMADALGVFGDAAVQKVLDNLSQQKLVHRDVLPFSLPVTPDSWISCSERMPNTKTAVLVAVEFDRKGDWRMKWATYIPGHPDANDGWIIPGASWKPSHWMPLPEPPQEAK